MDFFDLDYFLSHFFSKSDKFYSIENIVSNEYKIEFLDSLK